MSICLVTGITGQDASYLAEQLLNDGHKVVGLVRRSASEDRKLYNLVNVLNHPNFSLEFGDLSDTSSIWSFIGKYKPDEYYNLAAQSHVGASFKSPESTFDINAKGVIATLEAIRTLSPHTKFYQASTSELFGEAKQVPQNENTPFNPMSPYAVSKAAAHNAVVNYRKAYGLFACSGILFNHESERRGEQFVTRKITKGAARIVTGKQKKLVLGNLDAKRDWGHAEDYVRGMQMILRHHTPEDFVLATGETHTVREFVEEVFKLADLNMEDNLEINPEFMRPSEVPILLGDAAKAQKILGWKPRIGFKQLVKMMYYNDLKLEEHNG